MQETTYRIHPTNRWNLTEVTRCTVDGDQWVVFSDTRYTLAMLAYRFDRPTHETDYSEWCGGGEWAADDATCRAVALASGIDGIHNAQSLSWVGAE